MKCTYIKTNKEQCKANSMVGTQFCFRHSPRHATKAQKASQKGGANRTPSVTFQEELTLKTTKDIQILIGKVINGVWQGKIPIKVGSSIGFLTRCWLDAYEKAELEKKIDDLEKKLENNS